MARARASSSVSSCLASVAEKNLSPTWGDDDDEDVMYVEEMFERGKDAEEDVVEEWQRGSRRCLAAKRERFNFSLTESARVLAASSSCCCRCLCWLSAGMKLAFVVGMN